MPKTLLLADDSVVIQKLVGLSFANEDVEIVATDNGDDAITKAREVVPDVVLADVVMPGKSGYEVCEEIKQDPRLSHIPVLLLTGTFEAFDESRATSARADGQITKPFEAHALVERVTEFMNRPIPEPAAVAPAPVAAPPAAERDDFFDPNVTTLSPFDAPAASDGASAAGRAATTDSTPAQRRDTSVSKLFGVPGEGANEDLEIEGGGLALGQTVSSGGAARVPTEDATVMIFDERPPLESSDDTPSIDEFDEDFGLDDPVPLAQPVSASTADLDSALEAASGADEPTILVARDDVNATTSPNYDAQAGSQSPLEERTVHATTAPPLPDHAAQAPAPGGPVAGRAPVVADLDASLDQTGASRDAVRARDASGGALDLGPSSIASEDIDFGFDVSEQAPPGSYGMAPEDSFSSLMDISESTLLQDPEPTSDSQDPVAESPEALGAPAVPEADDSMAGYDVSSSDLATAAQPHDAPSLSGVEISEPIAASDSPFPTPSLPPQHAAEAIGSDSGGRADAPIAGADTGVGAQAGEQVLAPVEVSPEPAGSVPSQSWAATADDLAAGVFGTAVPLVDDAEEIESPAEAQPEPEEARPVPDLSPLMEQRIQETLEKVAWEAFSDLSESIVKQVMSRVEQIAWDVIPQMAETLVREEIRKMKGEED